MEDCSVPFAFLRTVYVDDFGYKVPISESAAAAAKSVTRAALVQASSSPKIGLSMADGDEKEHRRAARRLELERAKAQRAKVVQVQAEVYSARFLQLMPKAAPLSFSKSAAELRGSPEGREPRSSRAVSEEDLLHLDSPVAQSVAQSFSSSVCRLDAASVNNSGPLLRAAALGEFRRSQSREGKRDKNLRAAELKSRADDFKNRAVAAKKSVGGAQRRALRGGCDFTHSAAEAQMLRLDPTLTYVAPPLMRDRDVYTLRRPKSKTRPVHVTCSSEDVLAVRNGPTRLSRQASPMNNDWADWADLEAAGSSHFVALPKSVVLPRLQPRLQPNPIPLDSRPFSPDVDFGEL